MGKYCCFFDPARDYKDKALTDLCPQCGRPYNYVLENMPTEIVNNTRIYTVIKAIGRGFYGATYLCEVQKRFKRENVLLKVTPVTLYSFFGKNFEAECNKHAEVSENTEHLVKIEDAFDAQVTFGTETILCHVAELQYIEGRVLAEYIEDKNHHQPKIFAQIAIDLLKLWHELISKGEFHNDLHLGNLIVGQLGHTVQRVDAIYDKIQLVAIDLNSVTDESLSNSEGSRIGDRKYIANHISLLAKKLREKYNNIDEITDTDFRLIETLNKISGILSVPTSSVDPPEISELIEMIKEELKSNISYAPWKKTFSLTKLNDGINAQTLPSCHVPELLVDPEGKWIDEISVSGPQLITGMRGCGKTMLLAALDIHARLAVAASTNCSHIIPDSYVSIMASCRDLVEVADIETQGISKLILLYSVQIIRAARHIRDLYPEDVNKDYYTMLAQNLESIFGISFEEKLLHSDTVFERHLSDLSNQIDKFCERTTIQVSCISAFEMIADSLLSASDIFNGKQVYFLLDDASTRYMSVEKISALFTKVLFMSQKCAFKVTTELQTLYSFRSPGNIEMAHDIRDFQIFDLGADVFRRTRNPKIGKKFIEDIIAKRLEACNGLSKDLHSLEGVLGDCTLSDLANYIIDNTSSKARKTTYYGATALAALCVGDIGDIICLYDSIISNNEKGTLPVDKKVQMQCFQQLCSRRMYNLERKDSTLREYVKAFSEASYKCLMDSKKVTTRDGTKSERIRQYNSLYIRMTSGDIEKQQEKLRRLIDSGIFVYSDGNGWPRSKSGDTDPMTQTKLAFRKLFGLSNFIGLANADRFELSGDALEQWLMKPTKELLLRNLGKYEEPIDYSEESGPDTSVDVKKQLEEIVGPNSQLSLFDACQEVETDSLTTKARYVLNDDIAERAKIISHNKPIENKHFDACVLGLGFEERCLESAKRIIRNNHFSRIILVQYDESGYSNEIIKTVSGNRDVIIVKFDDIVSITDSLKDANTVLVDTTGLYKPIIFEAIRYSIMEGKKVSVVHTSAKDYYPLNSDIKKLIDSHSVDDASRFADLMSGLDTGDEGAYCHMKLLEGTDYDPVRPTAIVGFVSPKNQRIFSILDKVEYESIHLYVPQGNTPRDILSQAAGNIAITNYSSVRVKQFNTKKPKDVFKELSRSYAEMYIDKSFNFELSLTGSKMQAVVAAVFSSVCKVSQCWYVKPNKFDTKHFTKGVGETKWYTIRTTV